MYVVGPGVWYGLATYQNHTTRSRLPSNPKAFARNSSIKARVDVLKNAVSRPKASYNRMKKRAKEVHAFERLPKADVFSNLKRTLRSQTKAFKVSIELGYDRINIQTGEKRYYSPGWSTRISDNTIAINKKSEIQSKIFDTMNSTAFASTIKYPSSSYKLDEITAVSATLFYRDH